MDTTWQALIANLAVVALVTSTWSQLQIWLDSRSAMVRRAISGLLIGGGAVVSLVMSIQTGPDVFFDLRAGLIAVGAFFGGPVVATISVLIAGAYRLSQGGEWAIIAVINMVVTAAGALGLRKWNDSATPQPHLVLLLGVLVAFLVWATLTFLPANAVNEPMHALALPVAMVSFLATTLMGFTVWQARSGLWERRILQAALLQAPDFQFVKDIKSAFVAANQAVVQHNGFDNPAQLVGKTDFDLVEPARAQVLFEQEQDIIRTGRSITDLEETTVGPDQVSRSYRTSKVPLRDGDNRIIGIAGVTVETTAQKRMEMELRSSEEKFRIAMEHASIGMTLLEPSGRWLGVNKALADLLGYSQDELLEQNFRTVTHPDDLATSDQLVRQLLDGEIETYTIEKRYLRKNGDTVWAQLSASAVRNPDGSVKYLVAQIQDITERREVERVKNELISTVSHELRTPVTAIRGALGLLAGTMAAELPLKVRNLIDIANKNSERLILLVNDMLDIDKIASGKMQFDMRREFVAPMILSAIETNQPYADRFGVQIGTNAGDVDAQVRVDPARLQQVMSNLLSNAAKFSPVGGQVEVTLSADDQTCRVEVTDQGQGVSKDFAPLIFSKFSQADSSATRTKYGSGLGLHISREIITQMGGAIGFDSEPDKGATFWIELPLAAE
ncbi:PAS domain S-box protein [Devosia sp. BSSL-BM10]|uniref:histidine kinase n=1 Tax=Devosia litorisediminis TaxID=2829817 RepID=A0A942ECL2_9HYPH|nr:PAS domain S-box protein [Devosia litorisediminis]MBS3848839.1 PAS domain S-box protein [Devosia litorisediminis]